MQRVVEATMKRTALAMFAALVLPAMAGVVQGLEPLSGAGIGSGAGQQRGGCTLEALGTVSAQASSSTPVPAGWRRVGGGPVTRQGNLGMDCVSPNWNGELARYYSFVLAQAAEVEITITSSAIGAWVGLRQGENASGSLLAQASAWAGDVASVTESLRPGAYTIEASSPEEGVARTGPFTVTVAASVVTGADASRRLGGGSTRRGGTASAQTNSAGRSVAQPSNRAGGNGRNRAGTARRRNTSPRVGEVFTDCDDCPRMVAVPGGNFRMGTNQESREQPIHNVRIRRFAIGVEEVTTDDVEAWYQDTRGRGAPPCGSQEQRGAAAACLSWYDAKAYVAWLSRKTGQRYRLLTEAEWEYVAQRPYDFGVYDMIGNVWEWVEDCWHDSYRGAPTDGSAWTTGGADCRRVVRGGSWVDHHRGVSPSRRARQEPRRPSARRPSVFALRGRLISS